MATILDFQPIVSKYETFDQVKEYLNSDDGGKIRVVESGDYDGRYAIFRYTKGQSDMNNKLTHMFRSVVWDRVLNIPVSVAPVKAQNTFPPSMKFSAVEDFVDGVMVNLFINHTVNQVVLTTRTSINAQGTFYSKKSFHDMFLDAINLNGYNSLEDFAKLFYGTVEEGHISTFVSLVLQHPHHRIVSRVLMPRVYVVSLGSVHAQDTGLAVHMIQELSSATLQKFLVQKYPMKNFQSADDINNFMRQTAVQKGWTWQGLVFKDSEGNRWRLRSTTYQHMRNLRGSEASVVERFLRHRHEGSIKEYLQHYSEDSDEFWSLEQNLRLKTQNVFEAYRRIHKQHIMHFHELSKEFQTPVYRLHMLYLDGKKNGAPITIEMRHAIKLVNELLPYEQKRLIDAASIVFSVSSNNSVSSKVE